LVTQKRWAKSILARKLVVWQRSKAKPAESDIYGCVENKTKLIDVARNQKKTKARRDSKKKGCVKKSQKKLSCTEEDDAKTKVAKSRFQDHQLVFSMSLFKPPNGNPSSWSYYRLLKDTNLWSAPIIYVSLMLGIRAAC